MTHFENGTGPASRLSVKPSFKNPLQGIFRLGNLALLALQIVHVSLAADQWQYSWNNRTDRYGKLAGTFEETPFPITETSSSYTIRTDEFPEGKAYLLGTKYYVDGATGNDGNNGLSLETPKLTITAAVQAAGSGNKTIIVRGPHNGFDGIYRETISFSGIAGANDTNRFTLVGFGQERPIIDGNDSTSPIIRRSHSSPAFITVQRFKLQNTQASGVRLGWDAATDKRDQNFNCIDLWFFGCGSVTADLNGFATSGNCYYLNADNGFISHCTFERSVGHGVKIGDGASNIILEWSIARENGWWPGRTKFGSRTVAIDFPSDRDTQTNLIVRYCVAKGNVMHGLQLRRVRDFRVYGNEISDFGHGIDMEGDMGGVVPLGVVILSTSWGSFSNNVVHSPHIANTNGHLLNIQTSVTNSHVLIANNLFYEAAQNASSIHLGFGNAAKTMLYNNTLVQSNDTSVIGIRAAQGSVPELVNNIIWQQGTGKAGELIFNSQQPVHLNNTYYFPIGGAPSWGVSGSGEKIQDPKLRIIPRGIFSKEFTQLAPGSPLVNGGIKLDGIPVFDINGRSRSTRVDVGAAQYQAISAPRNVRVQ